MVGTSTETSRDREGAAAPPGRSLAVAAPAEQPPGGPVVFLDKDGTLVDDVPYNVDPARIVLARGAADGLPRLAAAGWRLAVVSNQSGVARGLFPESALAGVERRLGELLGDIGVSLAAFDHCPHLTGCDCRKPAPGMIARTAERLGVDPRDCWMVGDILDDIEAGRRAGCRTVLIANGNETEWVPGPDREPHHTVPDLAAAADAILRFGPPLPRHGGEGAGAARWADALNVLAVRLDAMGDVLMTGPALRALAEAVPGRRLTLLTSPAGAAAAALLPGLADILVHDAPWMKATAPRADAAADLSLLDRLRAGRFDAAVVFTVYSQNPLPAALMLYLADIPRRAAHCRENPYQLLTDWLPETEPEAGVRHEVRRQFDLAAALGCRVADERMRVEIPAAAVERVRNRLAGLGLGDRWAVVHSGASAPSRRYPPELFAAACRLLAGQGVGLVFTGAAAERPLVAEVRERAGVPSHTLAGELSLAETAALLQLAPVLVSNNTGPAHLAAAVGCPVVDLYALTNPQHTPWLVPSRVLSHDVPCRWCYKSVCPLGHHDCLRKVPPAAVAAATLELLTEAR